MKRLLLLLLPLLWCAIAVAQQPVPLTPDEISAQIASLRVARALNLRQDQTAPLKQLLQQVSVARDKQAETLDQLWAQAEAPLQQVDQALLSGQEAPRAAVTAAEQASRQYRGAREAFDTTVGDVAQKVAALLDREQAKLLETPQQEQARLQNAERFRGAANLAEYIAAYAVAMRELPPDEYDTLRSAMGLRLATSLVSPDDRRFNNAVNDVLRLLDAVRRMSDAEFAQRSEQMPEAVARALGLQGGPDQAGSRFPVTWGAFVDFVAGEQTLPALEIFQPLPALEVQP